VTTASTPSRIVHAFFDVSMSWSHASLRAALQENTKKSVLGTNEVAVFINRSWTACKILVATDALFYYRSKAPITIEALRYLPTIFGARRYELGATLEKALEKAFEANIGKSMARLKLAHA
jgi:hypothetical protein